MNLEWLKFWKKSPPPAPVAEEPESWWISLSKAEEMLKARLDELDKDFLDTDSSTNRAKIIARATEVRSWLSWIGENAEK